MSKAWDDHQTADWRLSLALAVCTCAVVLVALFLAL